MCCIVFCLCLCLSLCVYVCVQYISSKRNVADASLANPACEEYCPVRLGYRWLPMKRTSACDKQWPMVDVKLGFQDLSNNKRIALFYELLFCLQFVWFNLKLLGAKIYTFIETNERRGSAAVFMWIATWKLIWFKMCREYILLMVTRKYCIIISHRIFLLQWHLVIIGSVNLSNGHCMVPVFMFSVS